MASTASPSILGFRIMVRARVRGHLDALKKRFPDLLGDCEIQESAGTDYAFRVFVQKSGWTQVLAGLAEETDYDNFKSEVAHHQGRAGAAYEHSLHEVWSVMHTGCKYGCALRRPSHFLSYPRPVRCG